MPNYKKDVSDFKKWIPVKNWFTNNMSVVPVGMSSISGACATVNTKVNKGFVYVRDGISDTWKLPPAFKSDGFGDCEDFSIYKMFKLFESGIPQQLTELVICFDRKSREYHCVLRVFEGANHYVLDNQNVNVLNKTAFLGRYSPVYAIGLSGWRLTSE